MIGVVAENSPLLQYEGTGCSNELARLWFSAAWNVKFTSITSTMGHLQRV
jgi:hypothetical protein